MIDGTGWIAYVNEVRHAVMYFKDLDGVTYAGLLGRDNVDERPVYGLEFYRDMADWERFTQEADD